MADVNDKKWQKRFIDLAQLISTWSKDTTKVGAVLVTKDCKIIGQGYNGLIAGIDDKHLELGREFKIDHTIHAEINALANISMNNNHGELYMFVTKPVCLECAKALAANKIKAIYALSSDDPNFKSRWNNDKAQAVLKNTGVKYIEIKP